MNISCSFNGTENGVSPKMLEQELRGLTFERLQKVERKIIEGISHTGTGSVMQAIGVRNPCTTPIQTSEKKFLLTLLVTNFERL